MGPRLQRPSHRRRDKVAGGRGRIRQHGLGGIVDVDGCASASDSGSSSSPSGRAVRSWLQIGILGFASVSVGEGFNRLLDTIRPPPEWRGRIPGLQVPLWVQVTPDQAHPSKSRLMTVQDFFKYTNLEGQRFFDDLDRDGDGRVTLDDVKVAMRKRNLPVQYAKDFMNRVRRNRWWLSSIGWSDFKSLVDEREADMLKAFTGLELTSDGHLELNGIKRSLQRMGLPNTDDNAISMLRALEAPSDGLVTYGTFRNFLILLPDEHIQSDSGLEPAITWFESATMVPFAPPMERNQTAKVVITAALAGALASGSSTIVLHPLDTLKTRLQASVGERLGMGQVLRSIPQIGAVGLYRGIIPASVGAASAHGIRTGAQELILKLLEAVAGGAWELQATGVASGIGTLLGTACRIPCEVLKQRLQVGTHDNVAEALQVATAGPGGARGLFVGTAATLGREIPFYVLGMVGYEQLKKLFSGEMLAGAGQARELTSAQTIGIGALSGAIAAVLTTPADVIKTRIMTLPAGQSFSFGQMVLEIAQKEGFAAFFKGALARSLWIAPVGAMNFAGYELAKQGASFAGLGTSSGPVESQGMRPRDGDDKDACGRWMSDGTRNRGQAMLSSGQGPELDKPKGASRAGGSSKMPDIRAPQGGAPHAASTTEQPGNAQVLCGPGDSGSSATRGAIAVPSQQAELQAEKTWACASDSSQLPRDLVDASAEAYQAAMDGSVSAGARPPIHPIGGSSATKAGA